MDKSTISTGPWLQVRKLLVYQAGFFGIRPFEKQPASSHLVAVRAGRIETSLDDATSRLLSGFLQLAFQLLGHVGHVGCLLLDIFGNMNENYWWVHELSI